MAVLSAPVLFWMTVQLSTVVRAASHFSGPVLPTSACNLPLGPPEQVRKVVEPLERVPHNGDRALREAGVALQVGRALPHAGRPDVQRRQRVAVVHYALRRRGGGQGGV